MRPNEIVESLLKEKGIPKAEFARMLNISRGTLQQRLTQKNMSTVLLNEMLNLLGYEIAIQPRKSGRRVEGQVIVD